MFLAGCPVHQQPGAGTQFKLHETQTDRQYYLYLPDSYDMDKSYPLVVTIHGFSPFDTADRQIREWQSTADEYGLIVVAPVLGTANQVMLRLNEVSAGVKRDELAVMNVLDQVLSHTTADPDKVLITGWSTGGFLMHYMANRHPTSFSAICSRGSCFNSIVLSEENARLMGKNNFPVMIFYGQDDGLNIKMESDFAIEWYRERGFAVESFVIPQTRFIPGVPLGHNRQPRLAASFFLRAMGLIGKLRIVTSAESGPAPFPLSLSVQLPHHLDAEGLSYLWTLDGEYLAQTPQVYTSIARTGPHDIRVTITDSRGNALSAERRITVVPPDS